MNILFDKKALNHHRQRARARIAQHDFLHQEISHRLLERLYDVQYSFKHVLCSGFFGTVPTTKSPFIPDTLTSNFPFGALTQCASLGQIFQTSPTLIAFEEDLFPFAAHSFDLIISCLNLHWVDDLPGALAQIKRLLKPDGLFLAVLLGGETLHELRASMLQAELQCSQGLSPRLSPYLSVLDAAALMQRAGFALPVVDTESLTVTYSTSLQLMQELRGMGETNALKERAFTFSPRQLFLQTEAFYRSQFGRAAHPAKTDAEGTSIKVLPATFQMIYLTGWAPAANQPKALQPGSGQLNLAEVLAIKE